MQTNFASAAIAQLCVIHCQRHKSHTYITHSCLVNTDLICGTCYSLQSFSPSVDADSQDLHFKSVFD